MKKVISIFALICMTMFLIPASAGPDERQQRLVERATKALELTSTQQGLLSAYLDEKRLLRKQKMDAIEGRKNHESSNLFSSDKDLTVDQVNTALTEKQTKRLGTKQASIAAFVNFHNSLSTEQRKEGKKFLRKLLKEKRKPVKALYLKDF